MKFLVMILTTIAVLVSASIEDHQPLTMSMDSIYFSERLVKSQLRLDEKFVEVLAGGIQDMEEEMEELGGKETRLLSQYNDLKRGQNICKIGRKHDGEFPANQTLIVQQIQDRKELLSTVSALSQVNTQILKLMNDKLKFHEMSMSIMVDIPKHHQKLIQLQSNPHYSQSQSRSFTIETSPYSFVCNDNDCSYVDISKAS